MIEYVALGFTKLHFDVTKHFIYLTHMSLNAVKSALFSNQELLYINSTLPADNFPKWIQVSFGKITMEYSIVL